MNKEIECETCIKRKTMYCPNSSECMSTEDKPHYQNRIMLLEEKQHLEHNWNELKSWLEEIYVRWKNWYANDLDSHDRRYYEKEYNYKMSVYEDVLDKISELEEGGNND